jgi:3-hydroxyisobutyrate dehydrogenase-like beta-hydroxyacid dehydrogenase
MNTQTLDHSKIAFVGLGNMGNPMATNLIKAEFPIHLYNRTPEKLSGYDASNVRRFTSVVDAVKDVDVVITMLSDDAAVKEISVKILPAMKKGAIHLSMSTISPATATLLEGAANHFGIHYLAAPVLGRPPAAEAKQLFILLSGKADAKEKTKTILNALGQRIFDYGDAPATANTVKLLMNYMIFITTGMLSEVMLTAEKASIDKQALLEMMTGTIFGAPVIKNYGAMIVAEKDNPNGFATRLASKDLQLMQETASQLNLTLPLGEVMQAHFKAMMKDGLGEKDVTTVVGYLRGRSKE